MRAAAILVIGAVCLTQTAPAAPGGVLKRFAQLDGDGAQLTHEGWEKVAALFTAPGARARPGQLSIVGDRYHVQGGRQTVQPTAAGRIEYTHVGLLDMATGVFSPEHAGLALREDYQVVLAPGATPSWKIDGRVPEPHVTRTAAVRYVTEWIGRTSDESVRKNLRAALDALKPRR